jgi:hypothetical protein
MENTQATATTTESAPLPDNQATISALVTRLIEIEGILEGCKPLYDEKDAISLQLNALVGAGPDKALFAGDKVVTVVDNFSEKNTQFRPAAFKRIEAKVEGIETYTKRLKKAMRSDT